MELYFRDCQTEKNIIGMDLFMEDDDGTQKYDWPFLPRIGETIDLICETGDIRGIVRRVHWSSVMGYLNAVAVYIETIPTA